MCMYVYTPEVTPDSVAGSTQDATGNGALDPLAKGRRLAVKGRRLASRPPGPRGNMHVNVYMYICTCVCVYIYIYIYDRGSTRGAGATYGRRTGATAPRAGIGHSPGRAANVQEHHVASQLMVLQKVRRWHWQIYIYNTYVNMYVCIYAYTYVYVCIYAYTYV